MATLSTSRFVKQLANWVTAITILINIYLYTYPSFNSERCSWATTEVKTGSLTNWESLVLQIPYFGDIFQQYFLDESKLEDNSDDIKILALGDPQINGNWPNTPYIKRLDNFGNDYYLGHIYRTMKRRLLPSHVAVMGDLFSSQWISDSEYYNRTRRYMTRLFPQPEQHTLDAMNFVDKHEDVDWRTFYGWMNGNLNDGSFLKEEEYAYYDIYDWTKPRIEGQPLFINITGNHDVGYGDTTYQHLARYRKLFGKDNYFIEYDNNTDHPWRIVVLNSLALDGPLLQPEFQTYTWQFVEMLSKQKYPGQTILMTHIPFYKREGLCIDGPFVEYFTEENALEDYRIGLLKSENHLQYETSQKVLNAVFQSGKPGIVLTGHDHEGCENFYSKDENNVWVADKSVKNKNFYIKEATVRAMMGDFDGHAGIMTGHLNKSTGLWEWNYSSCPFSVQHVWWVGHVGIALSILLQSIGFLI
ncbi:BA75_00515T0 [Komagataella pastoris]|uniref:BA75_00515T0 n=1 Tax=Komagataella pastoris TaxID=4922 RepID=A0A1B2J6Q5_PICPA|nr:BA75_00515T0 [Komagataella pastoris]